jgi:hypothetical protein
MRRALISAVAVVILLVAGDFLVWRWAASRLDAGYAGWVQGQRAAGWTVTNGEPSTSGWPFSAKLTIPDLFLSGGRPDIPGGLTWSGDRVVLTVALLHPGRLGIALEGMQRLRVADGADIPFTADQLAVTVPLDADAPARFADLSATNLRVGLPEGGIAANPLTLALVHVHLDSTPAAAQGESALAIAGSAQDIGLPAPPAGRAWPLGPRIASVSFEAALTGPLPLAADIAVRAAEWRDGGGTLEIRRLALGWGPLGLSASATLALDEHMQPMGAGSAHIVGEDATIAALVANRVVTASAATAARTILGLMSRAPDGGGAPEVDVPLTLQNRTLTMGRIPLAKLPELLWPQAAVPRSIPPPPSPPPPSPASVAPPAVQPALAN